MTVPEYSLRIFEDPELLKWVGIPQTWPMPGLEEELPDIATWSDIAANEVWERSGLVPTPQDLQVLRKILAYAAETYPHHYPGFSVFLYLPEPRAMPIAAYIGEVDASDITAEEAVEDVQLVAGKDDPIAVESPVVEEFSSPHLGSGVRVMRYLTNEDDGTINVGLRYGWYIPQLQRQLFLFSFALDPGHMLSALEDIDEFASGMRYIAK